MRFSISLFLLTAALPACSAAVDAPAGTGSQDEAVSGEAPTTYTSIDSFFTTPAELAAWKAAVANLKLQFDDICGDTFCGSDYSNFEPLDLSCGVSSVRGSVKSCVWTFAASEGLVNPVNGQVTSSVPCHTCTFGTTLYAKAFTKFLADPNSLQNTLPGLNDSIYDVVSTCLQNPINATPFAAPTGQPYTDASQASTTDQGAWYDMTGAIAGSFADECPGSFCQDEFQNLTSYGFTCSSDIASTKIHACRWAFAGSMASVDAKTGLVSVGEKSYDCVIPAHGTVANLIAVLGASGPGEPPDRTLPGEKETLAQALGKCL